MLWVCKSGDFGNHLFYLNCIGLCLLFSRGDCTKADVGVWPVSTPGSVRVDLICVCHSIWAVGLSQLPPGSCLSSYTVSPLSPQDYESKLQALQKQVETRSLAAETTEEEEEEEEGEFEAKNNLDIAKPKEQLLYRLL